MTVQGWGNVVRDLRPKFIDINSAGPETHALTIGNCRSYGDICISQNHSYIDGCLYDNILSFDHENALIEVEAGITLNMLLKFILPYNLVLMVSPGTSYATVGGCIANDVHGKNHETLGSFAESVVKFTLRLPEGDIITCSRTDNSDIFWATIGGMGLTGSILTAIIKLKPVDNSVISVTRTRQPSLHALINAMDRYKNAPYSVAWIDMSETGKNLGRGVLEIAYHAPTGIIVPYKNKNHKVPFFMPPWTLHPRIVKMFNFCYYNRKFANRHRFEAYEKFQYPLDSLLEWNKLYGQKGFYQFQCVLPFDQADKVIRNIIHLVNHAGFISPLSVLKRLGAQGQGLLSFPMPGYTLAIDIPNKEGAVKLMQTLENIALEAGGRIYPAKDAIMSANSFAIMYPNKDKFLSILKKINAKPLSRAAYRYGLNYE